MRDSVRPLSSHPLLSSSLQNDYRRIGYWEDLTLADFVRDWSARTPDRQAIRGEHPLTYRELFESASRLAGALRAEGMQTGEFVVAILSNCWQGIVLSVAAQIAGVALAPLSARMSPTLVTNLFEQVGGRGLALQADLLSRPEWEDALASLRGRLEGRPVIVQGEAPKSYSQLPRLEDLADHGPAIDQRDRDPGRLSLVISTGGTTGRPKSVMHCENTVVYSAREFAKALHYTEADVHVAFGPYGHASGSIHEIYLPLMYGASVLPNPRWQPLEVGKAIDRFGGSCCITVGTHMFDLLEMDRVGDAPFRTLRLVTSGAGPDHLYENAERRFGFKVVRVFGLSECLGHAVGRPDDPPEIRWHADGVPFPGIENVILDSEGRPCPPGVPGEYAVRGPSMFMGYYGQPDLTASSLTADGFYRTGDLMVRGDTGYITWSGRIKDVIRRGGLQIDAIELENLLALHEGIREVAVIGEPDPRLGERAVIVAVPHNDRPRPTLYELTEYLRAGGMAKESLPEKLCFTESLPRTEFGKFHRLQIKAWLTAQSS